MSLIIFQHVGGYYLKKQHFISQSYNMFLLNRLKCVISCLRKKRHTKFSLFWACPTFSNMLSWWLNNFPCTQYIVSFFAHTKYPGFCAMCFRCRLLGFIQIQPLPMPGLYFAKISVTLPSKTRYFPYNYAMFCFRFPPTAASVVPREDVYFQET